jgi:hypothetical protein
LAGVEGLEGVEEGGARGVGEVDEDPPLSKGLDEGPALRCQPTPAPAPSQRRGRRPEAGVGQVHEGDPEQRPLRHEAHVGGRVESVPSLDGEVHGEAARG